MSLFAGTAVGCCSARAPSLIVGHHDPWDTTSPEPTLWFLPCLSFLQCIGLAGSGVSSAAGDAWLWVLLVEHCTP